MTPETRELYTLLLAGRYLRYWMNNDGNSVAVVYEGNQVPLKAFPACAGSELKHLLKADRKDKFRFTINRNTVRQLDGRTWFKKFFKQQIKYNKEKNETKHSYHFRQSALW